MTPWFTVERIDDATFALSEYRHWEETHSYLLLGRDRALLLDTGLGVGDLRREVEALTDRPVTVALTHVHWDHIGGCGQFAAPAVHAAEVDWLRRFPLPEAAVRRQLCARDPLFPAGFSPENYRVFSGEPGRVLREGDIIDLGGQQVQVLHTPGHSPGHCCYYEAARGRLYAGDLLYRGCLDAFSPTTSPEDYLASLERIAALPLREILPGHHALNCPPDLAVRARDGFRRLWERGLLHQGAGRFDFGDFQVHL